MRYLYGFNEPRSTLLVCSSSIFSTCWAASGWPGVWRGCPRFSRPSGLLALLASQPGHDNNIQGVPSSQPDLSPLFSILLREWKSMEWGKMFMVKTSAPIEALENYDRPTWQAQGTFKDQPTNRRTWELIGKLHFQNTFIYISHDWIDINRVFGK